MTKQDLISKVKTLNLPKDSYVVFGSGPLVALGIREVNDIDLLVSSEIYKQLKSLGWQRIYKGPKDTPIIHDIFEAHDNWDFSSYSPTLTDLLRDGFDVDGVSFASLEDVRKWKVASNRPKDIADIKLINSYIEKQNA